jgi:hypothetical protein
MLRTHRKIVVRRAVLRVTAAGLVAAVSTAVAFGVQCGEAPGTSDRSAPAGCDDTPGTQPQPGPGTSTCTDWPDPKVAAPAGEEPDRW